MLGIELWLILILSVTDAELIPYIVWSQQSEVQYDGSSKVRNQGLNTPPFYSLLNTSRLNVTVKQPPESGIALHTLQDPMQTIESQEAKPSGRELPQSHPSKQSKLIPESKLDPDLRNETEKQTKYSLKAIQPQSIPKSMGQPPLDPQLMSIMKPTLPPKLETTKRNETGNESQTLSIQVPGPNQTQPSIKTRFPVPVKFPENKIEQKPAPVTVIIQPPSMQGSSPQVLKQGTEPSSASTFAPPESIHLQSKPKPIEKIQSNQDSQRTPNSESALPRCRTKLPSINSSMSMESTKNAIQQSQQNSQPQPISQSISEPEKESQLLPTTTEFISYIQQTLQSEPQNQSSSLSEENKINQLTQTDSVKLQLLQSTPRTIPSLVSTNKSEPLESTPNSSIDWSSEELDTSKQISQSVLETEITTEPVSLVYSETYEQSQPNLNQPLPEPSQPPTLQPESSSESDLQTDSLAFIPTPGNQEETNAPVEVTEFVPIPISTTQLSSSKSYLNSSPPRKQILETLSTPQPEYLILDDNLQNVPVSLRNQVYSTLETSTPYQIPQSEPISQRENNIWVQPERYPQMITQSYSQTISQPSPQPIPIFQSQSTPRRDTSFIPRNDYQLYENEKTRSFNQMLKSVPESVSQYQPKPQLQPTFQPELNSENRFEPQYQTPKPKMPVFSNQPNKESELAFIPRPGYDRVPENIPQRIQQAEQFPQQQRLQKSEMSPYPFYPQNEHERIPNYFPRPSPYTSGEFTGPTIPQFAPQKYHQPLPIQQQPISYPHVPNPEGMMPYLPEHKSERLPPYIPRPSYDPFLIEQRNTPNNFQQSGTNQQFGAYPQAIPYPDLNRKLETYPQRPPPQLPHVVREPLYHPYHPDSYLPPRYLPLPSTESNSLISAPEITTYKSVSTTHKPVKVALEQNFDCKNGDGYYADKKSCSDYIECKSNLAIKHSCPDGLYFNPAAKWNEYLCASDVKCKNITSVEPKADASDPCPDKYGFFAMSNGDCSKYIRCQEGKPTIMDCPNGLAFNVDTSSCDWPENVPLCNPNVFKDFKCPEPPLDEEGKPSDFIFKYRYGNQCKLYVACQRGYPRLLSCDPGYLFDEQSHSCLNEKLVEDCS